MARTNSIGVSPDGVNLAQDLQEWMRTRNPFTRGEDQSPRIRMAPDRARYARWDRPVDVPWGERMSSPEFRSISGGDLRDRAAPYGFDRQVPSRKARTGVSGSADEVDEETREAQARRARVIRGEMRKRPDESVPAWLLAFPQQEMMLQSLVNRGNFAEARLLYEDLRQYVDDHYDELIGLTDVQWMGVDGQRLAELATNVVNETFLNTQVALFDGSKAPLGALVRDGGQIMMDAARDEFDGLGLPAETAEMMFNGSGQQRALLRGLVRPLLSGNQVPDRLQRVDLIDQVVSRWDELESVFGDGTAYLVQRLQDTHDGIGGAPALVSTLMGVARNIRGTQNLEGRDLVRETMGSYSDMQSALFRDKEGAPLKLQDIPVAQRLLLDSILSSTVQELDRRHAGADLRSPVFMLAVQEAMDLAAYGLSAGVDLVGAGHASGRNVPSAIAQYVADAMTLDPTTADPGNPVRKLQNLRELLGQRIRGGIDFADATWRLTGNPEDYLSSVARGVKGYSSSPGADGLADALQKQLFKELAPKVMGASSLDEVLAGSLNEELAGSVAQRVFQPYMAGPGSLGAAAALAEDSLRSFANGQAFTLQDKVMDLGFGKNSPLDNESRQTLRDWYYGNVTEVLRYQQQSQDLLSHYMVDEGLPAQKAVAMASRVRMTAAEAERLGLDPDAVYEEALAQGTVYRPDPAVWKDKVPYQDFVKTLYDPITGKKDPAGFPAVVKEVSDRRLAGWRYGQDNTAYETTQSALRQMYDQKQEFLQKHLQRVDAQNVAAEYRD